MWGGRLGFPGTPLNMCEGTLALKTITEVKLEFPEGVTWVLNVLIVNCLAISQLWQLGNIPESP